MSTVLRGMKNAFRNPTRTVSVALVFGVVVGLALAMLISREAVESRIVKVKESIGNTINISPAGARGFMGGGEPLKESDLDGLKSLSNVTQVSATLTENLVSDETTNLKSAVEAGTIGQRQGANVRLQINGAAGAASQGGEFKLPLPVSGIGSMEGAQAMGGGTPTLTSGQWFDAASEAREALVGKDLAEKNSLSVGSTFTAFNETVTVKGIFDAGNLFSNNSLFLPIKALQKLAKHEGEVSTAMVKIDSIDNADAVETAAKEKLGDKADVVSQKESAEAAVTPLVNIVQVTTISLIGTLVAGAVIIFLVMIMTVRERRKEVAVLKVLGASDGSIVTQFFSESVIMALLGSVLGIIAGIAMGNPILEMLAKQGQADGTDLAGAGGPGVGGAGPVMIRFGRSALPQAKEVLENLTGTVDYHIILYGLGVAVAIAIVGSLIPVIIASQIRPAEVLRGE